MDLRRRVFPQDSKRPQDSLCFLRFNRRRILSCALTSRRLATFNLQLATQRRIHSVAALPRCNPCRFESSGKRRRQSQAPGFSHRIRNVQRIRCVHCSLIGEEFCLARGGKLPSQPPRRGGEEAPLPMNLAPTNPPLPLPGRELNWLTDIAPIPGGAEGRFRGAMRAQTSGNSLPAHASRGEGIRYAVACASASFARALAAHCSATGRTSTSIP